MRRWSIRLILILNIVILLRTAGAQVCGSYGFFCDTCSTVQICQSGVPTGLSLTCPDGTYCDQASANICTTTDCTIEPYPFYECQEEGRFPWIYNCSEFIWCVNNTGTLVPSLNSCPPTTVFNPNTAGCVLATLYNCVDVLVTTTESTTPDESTIETTTPSIQTTTTIREDSTTITEDTTTNTTEMSPTTEDTTITTDSTPTTTTESSTTITEDTPTTTEDTIITTDSTTTATTESNPTTTETTESSSTITETTTTTTTAATSTTATTTTTTAAPLTCSAYGRFPITTDTTCQSYYLCYPNIDGTYTLLEMVCPTITLFNPTTATCVAPTAYTCTN